MRTNYLYMFERCSRFAVAVPAEFPIMVDKIAWEQGGLVGPAGG